MTDILVEQTVKKLVSDLQEQRKIIVKLSQEVSRLNKALEWYHERISDLERDMPTKKRIESLEKEFEDFKNQLEELEF